MAQQKTSSAHYHDYKPPYFKWWEDHFWSDLLVRRMAPTARHYYRALLLAAFFCDTRPFLPADDDLLWMIADAETKEDWLKHKAQVLAKFTEFTQDGKQLLRNKRLDEEWAALLENLEHSKNAGLASARARAAKSNARSTGVQQQLTSSQRASTKPQPTEPEPVTVTEPLPVTVPVSLSEPETVTVTETGTARLPQTREQLRGIQLGYSVCSIISARGQVIPKRVIPRISNRCSRATHMARSLKCWSGLWR